MTTYIGIDDTDSLESIGTGRLARMVAEIIGETGTVRSVTRHQFLVHPDIPYTSHNSGAVIEIADTTTGPDDLFSAVADAVMDRFVEGSDPGVAVAREEQISPAVVAFGSDAKTRVLTQDRAYEIAKNAGILLEGLGGTGGGVIGALAGIGLARTGSDGRYLQIGSIRDRPGDRTVEELLTLGAGEVMTTGGKVLTSGPVTIPKFPQPSRILGRPVLLVEERDGGYYMLKRD